MLKIIENINELNQFIEKMDSADNEWRIYHSGYVATFTSVDENGEEKTLENEYCFFIADDSEDDEETIKRKFFDLTVEKEMSMGGYPEFCVDYECETIDVYSVDSEKHYYGFAISTALEKEMVEWLANNLVA